MAKHADSDMARLELFCRDDCLLLVVEDDGIGIGDMARAFAGQQGVGLSNVRERIIFIGGSMELDSTPAGGTRAVLRMPAGRKCADEN